MFFGSSDAGRKISPEKLAWMAESPEQAEVTGGVSSTPQKETDVKNLSKERQQYHARPCRCICSDPEKRHGYRATVHTWQDEEVFRCICRNCPGANGTRCPTEFLNFTSYAKWAGLCEDCRTPEMEGESSQRSRMIENAADQCLWNETGGGALIRAPPGTHRGDLVENRPDYAQLHVWEDDEMELWAEWIPSSQYVRNGDLPPLM